MLAKSERFKHGIYQVEVEVNQPVLYGYYKMLSESLAADEETLRREMEFFSGESQKEKEYLKLTKIFSNVKACKGKDRYQGRFVLEPKTKNYYLNAVFTFDKIEDAENFIKTLECEFKIWVYARISIIPELIDIKSLYLSEQSNYLRMMYRRLKDKEKEKADYVETIWFIFDVANFCSAHSIYTEKCYADENDFFMVFGFRFDCIDNAKDFILAVTTYD